MNNTRASRPVPADLVEASNAAHAIPGPCMSCGLETVTNVPGFWLCQSCVELGFTVPVAGPEVSQPVSRGSDNGSESPTSASLQGSEGTSKGKRTSPSVRRKAAETPRSYCLECHATQRINRYDPKGKIHSIITTHQPACPVLPARRKTQHHD